MTGLIADIDLIKESENQEIPIGDQKISRRKKTLYRKLWMSDEFFRQ